MWTVFLVLDGASIRIVDIIDMESIVLSPVQVEELEVMVHEILSDNKR